MEIVKKNILSIICGVVALAAVIFWQWPVGGWYADQQKELDKRVKVSKDLGGLMMSKRHWPVLPTVANAQATLDHFPNDARISAGKQIEETVSKQAARMKEITADDNKHTPLLPDVFPVPGEQRFAFQRVYPIAVQKTLPADLQFSVTPPDPTGAVPVAAPGVVATEPIKPLPPTDAEIHAEADRVWNLTYKPRIVNVSGVKVNLPAVTDEWKEWAEKLPGAMRMERAQKLKMYIDDGAISISGSILNAPGGPKENEIWYAQCSLWVEQDLAAGLKRINENAKDVTESPVKHLTKMRVAQDQSMYVTAGGGARGIGPDIGGAGGPSSDVFAISPTGRVSNPLYDVIKFEMTMNVQASKIPAILNELQKGKLITINHVNATSFDGVTAADNGFIYGDVPVARLSIEGEDLFLRDWTVKLMPESVKKELGIPLTPPAGATH